MIVCQPLTGLIGMDVTHEASDSSSDSTQTAPSQKPNALENLNDIEKALEHRHLAVFLDYDGTLTPIVEIPSEAKISNKMTNIVAKIASLFPTAIITGRSIPVITNFVQLKNLYYAGSHGYDIRAPGAKQIVCQIGGKYLPLLEKARDRLRNILKHVPGNDVEDNKYAISVHYRRIESKHWEFVEKAVDAEIAACNGQLKKGCGKMVFEIRPNLDWHKGKAVRELLRTLGSCQANSSQGESESKTNSASADSIGMKRKDESTQKSVFKQMKKDTFAIYIGDDTTDEDAFRELEESKRGFGIRVLSKGGAITQKTSAMFVLNSVDEVGKFLNKLCEMKTTYESKF